MGSFGSSVVTLGSRAFQNNIYIYFLSVGHCYHKLASGFMGCWNNNILFGGCMWGVLGPQW